MKDNVFYFQKSELERAAQRAVEAERQRETQRQTIARQAAEL